MTRADAAIQQLHLAGRTVDLHVRRNPRARRLTLTVDQSRGVIRLTMPRGASQRNAEAFLAERRAWLESRVGDFPQPVPFEPGARFPLEGKEVAVAWDESWPRSPVLGGGRLSLGGPRTFVARRVGDFLRRRARLILENDCRTLAAAAGLAERVQRVSVRDTVSQWGSCTARGAVSLSWRLIFAPPFVRRAIAAHELAHLTQRGHGPAFHQEAARITDGGADAQDAARAWLRAHGSSLHWIGRE